MNNINYRKSSKSKDVHNRIELYKRLSSLDCQFRLRIDILLARVQIS